MLSQIPTLIKAESRDQLPDRNVALGRLFRSVKELVALTGQDSEHFPTIQSSLQIIIESIKKCTDTGVFANDAKFLSATNTFIAKLRTLAAEAVSRTQQEIATMTDPNTIADTQEKLEATQSAIVVFSVSLPTLANLSVAAPDDIAKLDHMLHDMASFLQVVLIILSKS